MNTTSPRILRAALLAAVAFAGLPGLPVAGATHDHDSLVHVGVPGFENGITDATVGLGLTTVADVNVRMTTYPDRCTVYVTGSVSGSSPAHEYAWFVGMVSPREFHLSADDDPGPVGDAGPVTFTYTFSVARGVEVEAEAWILNKDLTLDRASDRSSQLC